jgi:predicted nucleic acid-binding protein
LGSGCVRSSKYPLEQYHSSFLKLLIKMPGLVEMIGVDIYGEFEAEARERLATRDPEDWPILATALALRCPIWTEDTDFFGCGVPTWTSDRVQTFLRE